MKKIFEISIIILILSFFLPAGYIFSIPITNIFFVSSWVLLLSNFSMNKNIKNKLFTRVVTLSIPSISLVIWLVNSRNTYFSSSARQEFNSFTTLIFLPIMIWLCIENDMISTEKLNKVLFIGFISKLLFRLSIELWFIKGQIGNTELVDFYFNVFNAQPVTLLFSSILRIQVPSDALPLVVYSFILIDNKASKISKIILSLLVGLFVFVVYSRVFILQYVLIIITAYFMSNTKLTMKKIIFLTWVTILLLIVTFTVFYFDIFTLDTLLERFTGNETQTSDWIRNQQAIFLKSAFEEAVLYGKGIGYYPLSFIRNINTPFSYELEYLSFLMQFGIVGFFLIIIMSIIHFFSLINFQDIRKITYFFIIFNMVIWLFKPLFNPSFLTFNSASVIVVIIIFSYGNKVTGEDDIEKYSTNRSIR